MPRSPLNPRELGFYFALGQIGLEMVAPVVFGLILDHTFGWTPWGTVIGAALGFVGGLSHLVALLNRRDGPGPSQPPDSPR